MKVEVNRGSHTIISTRENDFDDLIKSIGKIEKEFCSIYKDKILKKLLDEWKDIFEELEESHLYNERAYLILSPYFKNKNVVANISDSFNEILLPTGFGESQMYIISAPSGKGKTALAIMLTVVLIGGINPLLAIQKTFDEKKVLYVSLEQEKKEIENRIISTFSALNNLNDALSFSSLMGEDNFEKFNDRKVAVDLYLNFEKNLKILTASDFGFDLSIDNVYLVIKQVCRYFEPDIIIVDQYDNVEQLDPVSNVVAQGLKNLSLELRKPIIVLAQINKNAVAMAQKKVGNFDVEKLSGNSLKGSSALEHQATSIFFIVPTDEKKSINGFEATKVFISQPKARYGANTTIQMWHIGALNLFIDYQEENNDVEGVCEV